MAAILVVLFAMSAVDADASPQIATPAAVVRLDNVALVPTDCLDFAESRTRRFAGARDLRPRRSTRGTIAGKFGDPARGCARPRARSPDASIAPAFRSRNLASGCGRTCTRARDLYRSSGEADRLPAHRRTLNSHGV